jgi:hypothetical protein
MGLAPVQPDQGVIDALSLDAAWEKARILEGELQMARHIAKENRKSFEAMAQRRLTMAYGIRAIISKYRDIAVPQDLLDELKALVEDN